MKAGNYIHADVVEDDHVVVKAECSSDLTLAIIADLIDTLERNTKYSAKQIVQMAQLTTERRRFIKQREAVSKSTGGDL